MHISNQLIDQADLLILKDDYESAAKLLRRASQLGNIAAYHNLAQLYLQNKCLCRNSIQTAIKMLTYCAKRGFLESQRTLGKMYYHGKDVKKDLAMARFWYSKATEQNVLKPTTVIFNKKGQFHFIR